MLKYYWFEYPVIAVYNPDRSIKCEYFWVWNCNHHFLEQAYTCLRVKNDIPLSAYDLGFAPAVGIHDSFEYFLARTNF